MRGESAHIEFATPYKALHEVSLDVHGSAHRPDLGHVLRRRAAPRLPLDARTRKPEHHDRLLQEGSYDSPTLVAEIRRHLRRQEAEGSGRGGVPTA
jgi:hypothetical protein